MGAGEQVPQADGQAHHGGRGRPPFVPDGSLLAIGGFGHIRVPMAMVYEMVRQRNAT